MLIFRVARFFPHDVGSLKIPGLGFDERTRANFFVELKFPVFSSMCFAERELSTEVISQKPAPFFSLKNECANLGRAKNTVLSLRNFYQPELFDSSFRKNRPHMRYEIDRFQYQMPEKTAWKLTYSCSFRNNFGHSSCQRASNKIVFRKFGSEKISCFENLIPEYADWQHCPPGMRPTWMEASVGN